MKQMVALTVLLCAFSFVARGDVKEDLTLELRMTTGERSRDSSSKTTSIAISGDTIIYKVTYGGRNRGREPKLKEFKLAGADKTRIVDLINAKHLLVTESIEYPTAESGPSYYFSLSISADVNGNKGLISIKGSRTAAEIKESELYKKASSLIEAVYEIIRRIDKDVLYEPLIRRTASTPATSTIE